MSPSSLKRQTAAFVATAIIFVVGVGLLWQIAVLMHTRTTKVFAANEQLASYEQNKEIFAEESKSLTAIGARVTALEAYRITPATLPQLLSSFESFAQGDGIDFAITNVETPGTNAEQKLLIDFSASGSEENIDAFLADLSHQTYQIQFTAFSLFANAVGDTSSISQKKLPPADPQWQVLASIQVVSY